MIFQHTIDKVLSGEKTQTRRPVKEGEYALNVWGTAIGDDLRIGNKDDNITIGSVHHKNGKRKWLMYHDYAAQPGRTQKGVARIRIKHIRREPVESLSEADVIAEGFANKFDFWETWKKMHKHTGMLCWVIEFELVREAL